jgi:hypothetical protein
MHFGATMWFTEYSILPSELGIALEEREFESLCPITICLYPEELDSFAPDQVGALARYEELGVTRCIVGLNPQKRDAILPILDRSTGFMRQMKA